MSEHNIETINQVTIPHTSNIHNLHTKAGEEAYQNPTLTRHDDKVYTYRFIKNVIQQIHTPADSETYDINHDIPYQFIVETLKYFVHNTHIEDRDKGWHPQVLLLLESKRKGYAMAIGVTMRDFLLTVISVERISISDFESIQLQFNPLEEKLFLKDLDIDACVDRAKEREKAKRKKIGKRYPLLWENATSGLSYRLKCTQHLTKSRSRTSGQRLTIPIEAVKDILVYALETSESVLKKYMGNSKKEKNLVLVLPSIDKNYHIGILIAIDDILVTAISMYDVSPKEKGYNSLVFPNTKRIFLSNYNLAEFMKTYYAKKAEQDRIRKKTLEHALKLARQQGGGIKVYASLEEYDAEYLRTRIISAKKSDKISKKVKKLKHINLTTKKSKYILEKVKQSISLGYGFEIMKKNTRKYNKIACERKG